MDYFLDMKFIVSARGLTSGRNAQTTFTDANPQNVTLSPGSVSVIAGNTANYTATVGVGGNNNACTITMNFAYTGTAPVGTTPTLTPSTLTMTNASVSSALNITTTNTGPMAGRTQPGTYNFTVTAVRGANCQGNGNLVASGVLVVGPIATPTPTPTPTPPPGTSLAVAAASGTYGGTTSFTATLTSSGSPGSGKTISFTRNGTSVGTATTNASGVATLSGVSLSGVNAGSYPSGVGASFAGDASFTGSSGSAPLTVNPKTATVTADN